MHLLKYWLLAALTFFAVHAAIAAPPGAVKRQQSVNDYETVRRAMQFSIGPVGFAAITSSEEVSFRNILRSLTAAADCRRLISEATTVGQLYGLLGLKILRDPAYERVAPSYQASRSRVQMAGGCTISPRPIAEIAKLIDTGEIK